VLIWLLVTLAVAIGSALFPLLSVELFVVALADRHPQYPAALLGAVIAVGQVAGKLLYFYAGRGSLRLPTFLHRQPAGPAETAAAESSPIPPQPARGWRIATARIAAGWAWLRVKCHRHPAWMFTATATSSVVGVPPFMATTVLAGLAGLSLRSFILACLPGRFIRFTLLAASPMLVVHWWPALHHWHHHFGLR
jgi:membrane protein YqaA with SNARE-associated domain